MNDIDWSQIRAVWYHDDPPARADLVAEVDWLRHLLGQRSTTDATRSEPPSILSGDLRRLAEKIDALSARLPPMLVPIPDAAEALGVSVSTIRRGIKSGDLPYRRLGRSVRIDLSACRGLDADDLSRMAREARSGRR
jgi:excisionase family DNA binding protein